MKFAVVLSTCAFIILNLTSVDGAKAEPCIPSKCSLSNGCVCSSMESPLPLEKTPQFVTISIDDSVSVASYNKSYSELLFNRKNADGSPISATFYVPHKYTDYEIVNSLYNKGFEIGDNSISKGSAEYFAKASLKELIEEFEGQRIILSKFANIPKNSIKGARTPHFQLAGNKTFEAYKVAGIEYDNSWVALSSSRFFPYSLHYKSSQPIIIGEAPTAPFPNQWVIPVNNLKGFTGKECNVLFGCEINGTAEVIKNWLYNQYNETKHSSRVPLHYLLNAALFERDQNSLEGFKLFLDDLKTEKDTFVVSHSELLKWTKNPQELGRYKPVVNNAPARCIPVTCALPFEDEIMYMRSCVSCPDVYPWLGNPEGEEF